jgi:hypothetical protein
MSLLIRASEKIFCALHYGAKKKSNCITMYINTSKNDVTLHYIILKAYVMVVINKPVLLYPQSFQESYIILNSLLQ